MEVLEQRQRNSFENLVLSLLIELEDGQHHPETWQKIASLAIDDIQALKRLTVYLSQLLAIPQSPQAMQLVATLEAVCLAYTGELSLATHKLQQLLQKYPDSLLISGAFGYIQQNTSSVSIKTQQESDPLLNMFTEFVTMQNKINHAMLSKLQVIEGTVNRAKIENLSYMHQKLHDIHQTLQMVARQTSHKPNRKIRCVFIVSFYQSWNTLAEVYKMMKASDDFEPIVVSTARKKAKDTQVIFGEEITHEFLKAEGIPHIRLDTALPNNNSLDILKALEPDIIFRQSAWQDLPPVFNAEDINFARLCYIPYSFTAVRRIDKDEPEDIVSSSRHTDLYYHRLCWRIFCETEMHKSMYENTSVRAGHNVVVTGYPKFDRLLADKQRSACWPITDSYSERRRFRIIWAPHHSVTPNAMRFGTFVEVHKEMLEWAKQSQDEYEFVLKPHPSLISEVVDSLKAFTREYMDAFFAEWNALSNTAITETGDYGPLFLGSDLMLTDGVGFLSEYQLFEKPLIFLDSGCHFGFNPAGAVMMESANQCKTIAEARILCDRLRQGELDPMYQKQKTMLPRIVPYPGQSAQKIVQAIREGLVAEGVV